MVLARLPCRFKQQAVYSRQEIDPVRVVPDLKHQARFRQIFNCDVVLLQWSTEPGERVPYTLGVCRGWTNPDVNIPVARRI